MFSLIISLCLTYDPRAEPFLAPRAQFEQTFKMAIQGLFLSSLVKLQSVVYEKMFFKAIVDGAQQ